MQSRDPDTMGLTGDFAAVVVRKERTVEEKESDHEELEMAGGRRGLRIEGSPDR